MAGAWLASSSSMASSVPAAIQSSIWPACSHTGMRWWISADTPLLFSDDGERAQVAIGQQRASVSPEAGRQQWAGGVDESRVFLPVLGADRPFLVARHEDDTATILEGRAECRLGGHRFDAGIDGRSLQAFALCPEGQRPHVIRVTCRPSPRSRMTAARWVGVRLKLGWISAKPGARSARSGRPKLTTGSWTNRPHVTPSWPYLLSNFCVRHARLIKLNPVYHLFLVMIFEIMPASSPISFGSISFIASSCAIGSFRATRA